MVRFSGCYTALITSFTKEGEVDWKGLERLIDFQISQGVSGILACGTTGESPTLTLREYYGVVRETQERVGGRCTVMVGAGSNSTQEALSASQLAVAQGVEALLLVDPYYNGPSSLEIRREYVEPVARSFPNTPIIPYIIPGRTGTQLLPEDLALLHDRYPNVCAVKEATGNFDNMRRIRRLLPREEFDILSGDDGKTWEMMEPTSGILATGVISVVSNIAPRAVQEMTEKFLQKNYEVALDLRRALQPLFDIVTVKTQEKTPFGPVTCRARNPLPIKTLMNILGMPAGPCRRPLGKMTGAGVGKVVAAAQAVHRIHPEIFAPIEEFFGVRVEERLWDSRLRAQLCYEEY